MECLQLEDHQKNCDKCLVSCSHNCGEMVPRCRLTSHIGRQGTCPGYRSDLLKHIESNMASHLSLMAMELTATKQKQECTEKELKSTKQELAKAEDKLANVELQLNEELNRRSLSLPSCQPSQFVHMWKIENWSQK